MSWQRAWQQQLEAIRVRATAPPEMSTPERAAALCIFDLTTISRQMQSDQLSRELLLLLTRLDCQARLLGLLTAHQSTAQRLRLQRCSPANGALIKL